MATGTATFTVSLQDGVTGGAKSASGALDAMRAKIEADEKALKGLEAAMKNLQKGTVISVGSFKALQSQISAKKSAIAGMTDDFLKLGGSFSKSSTTARATVSANLASARSFDQLARATKKLGFTAPDALSDLLEAVSTLPGLLLTASAAAVAFAAAVGVGLVVGIKSLIGFALESQEALEGVSQEVLNVASRSPIARSEINKLGLELQKTGLKGAKLEAALESAVKKKFGAAALKPMHDLSVQLAKAKENAQVLFSGLKTGPLLDAVANLFKFLDSSTVEGQALKTLLETLLQPVIDGLASAGPAAKKFFQGMIIGALQVAIAVLLVKKRLEDVVGFKLDLSQVDWTTIGQAVMFTAVAFGLVAAAIGAAIGVVLLMTGGALALGAAIVGLAVLAVTGMVGLAFAVIGAIGTMYNFVKSRFDAAVDLGASFVLGIANGIRSGLSDVINAAVEVASGAVKAIKDKLQMHSPSVLGKGVGSNLTKSIAMGQTDEIDSVKDAASRVGDAAIPTPDISGSKLGGGSGAQITIQNVNVSGVEGADDPSFGAKLAAALHVAFESHGIAVESAA